MSEKSEISHVMDGLRQIEIQLMELKTHRLHEPIVIRDIVHNALDPIKISLQEIKSRQDRHEQTLYGAEGANGLSGDLKDLKLRVDGLQSFHKKIANTFVVVQSLVLVIWGVITNFKVLGEFLNKIF